MYVATDSFSKYNSKRFIIKILAKQVHWKKIIIKNFNSTLSMLQ